MSVRPLVSVVTPTWQRRDVLVDRCVPSVRAQTYPHLEHVIVSDGPDDKLADLLPDDDRIAVWELDTHDVGARWGHWARLAGISEARGELIAYLDDDNAFRPQHLALLVAALEDNPGADFAFSRMLVHAGPTTYEVGSNPPTYGQVDTSIIVHRRGLLDRETWRPSLPTIDWDLVRRWMVAGADWVFVPEVTVDYYA